MSQLSKHLVSAVWRRQLHWQLLGVVLLCAFPRPGIADEEAEKVDQLLNRLGLSRLQIAHLEQIVRFEEREDPQNVQFARQLADLYASELMKSAEEPKKYQDLLTRVHDLLTRIPAAKTDTLDAMLLQADYGRAEKLATDWLAHRTNVTTQQEARIALTGLSEKLGNQYDRLNASMKALDDKIEATDVESELELLDAEFLSIRPIAAQTGFFAGWAKYYRGVLNGEKPPLAQARHVFRQLLELEDEEYKDIEASWLALESPWRARAWIGLGLTEAALGNVDNAEACFALLRKSGAPAPIRDQTDYWRVQALINASNWKAAETIGRNVNFTGGATQGKVSLCVALIRGAYCGPERSPRASLGEIGVTGLVFLKQWQVLQELVEEYNIPTDGDRPGFAWKWIQGHRLREKADGNRSPVDYRSARDTLLAALGEEGAKKDLSTASQCRAELAWCQFQLGEYEESAESYGMASSGLERSVPKAAEQAAWMQFVCLEKLARVQSRYVDAMRNAAVSLRERFPESEFADKADYAVRRMASGRDPAAAIVELQNVPKSDPDYLSACRDVCQLRYNLWRSSTNSDEKKSIANTLRVDWDRYQKVSSVESATSQLRVGLWVLEATMGNTSDATFVRKLTEDMQVLASKSPSLAANFHYLALSEASARGANTEVQTHMQWLMQNAKGTRFELSALITAAKRAEANVRDNAGDRAMLDEAYSTYKRLSESLGNDTATLKVKANARVALNRQAHFAAELGRVDEAATLTKKLVEAQPKSRGILKRACEVHIAAGQHEEALVMARTLLRGARAGTDDWYEAKLQQLICLRRVNVDTAKKVWSQFLKLDPKMGGDKWRDRFEDASKGL